MALLTITDSADSPNAADIDLVIDTSGSGRAKWKCRTIGAFRDSLTSDDWQEAVVKWYRNYRDEYVSTVYCYLDLWGDDQPLPCMELEDVYDNGVRSVGASGTGKLTLSRAGSMTIGDIAWSYRGGA